MHTQYLRQLTEERLGGTWRFVQELTDEQLAQQIEDDKIDILIEMMGHTECCRLGALVNKPAPIIVSYFGYPATTGLAAVDYKLVDADLVPTLEDKDVTVVAHNNYTEKLYRLSRGF
jgi:predicted O-linked N-acetylglucosamine transferase (SPINDLY family)